VTISEVTAADGCFFTALTAAQPKNLPELVPAGFSNDGELSELLTG
jgi:hypothetical protein